MKRNHLTYPLNQGYVDDWLVLGPCDVPIAARPADDETELSFRARLLSADSATQPDFSAPNELDRHTCGEHTLYWTVAHCEADHLVDWSGLCPNYTHRQAWASVNLASRAAQSAIFHLTTTCPASVWINGKLIGQCGGGAQLTELADQTPRTFTFTGALKTRNNEVLVRLDQIAIGHAALAFALRVTDTADKSVQVKVPTVTREVDYRLKLERAYLQAYLDRAICLGNDSFLLRFPHDTSVEASAVLRMQTPDGWIYGEAFGSVGPDTEIKGIYGLSSQNGPMQAMLMPPHQSYYELFMRAERKLAYWVANRAFSAVPQASYEERLVEAVRESSRIDDIYGELAQMGGDWWGSIDPRRIQTAIARVNGRDAGCLADLLGLISMRQHFGKHERFPTDILPSLDQSILSFNYAADDLETEADQILCYACRILAGQLFPRTRFAATGLTGRQERARGEEMAVPWLRARCRTGFSLWNSHHDPIVSALAHLADLAKDNLVTELSAVLLDKMLFSIAVQSLRGVFGGSRGHAEPVSLRTGRFAPEAGIGRLLWGTGTYQGGLRSATSLVLAGENYELPAIIPAIATDVEAEVWAHERHQIDGSDGPAGEVNTATYRTGSFLLSSAQDYRPGQRGRCEHIWQATLSPEALVFTNHPTSFSESESRQAGWWRGNGSLPRVAQWKDALIALYDLPEDAWLKFTHAYFPLYAFDEHVLEGGWACARVEDAYLAITASQGFELLKRGQDAYRELRSMGTRQAWLCQMGSRDTDTSFENFCRRVTASTPLVDGLHVTWKTLREDQIEFDWTGPLMLNGKEEPITGFKHHESLYGAAEFPAETMDIGYGADIMRLHFA
jgi:hypothetical protein